MTEGEKTTEKLTEILKRTRPSQAGRILDENSEHLVPAEGAFSEYVRGVFKRKGLSRQSAFIAASVSYWSISSKSLAICAAASVPCCGI